MTKRSPIEIRPLSPAVGAEVVGLDLSQPIDGESFGRLVQAFTDHCLLVFPAQQLEPAAQWSFGCLWGEPLVVPYLAPHAVTGFPGILRVPNMGKAETLTENWHFDSAFFEEPPPIAILAAQELPPIGGDTMWSNMYRAYEALSPAMQLLLGQVRAAFTGTRVDDGERRDVVTMHPVVRIHPVTGKRALAIGRIESVPHLEGMTPDESRPIIEFLYRHVARPEFVHRHHWRRGDVVMWDNRCLLHYAVHDYGDAPRLLHRMTVLGAPCT